jgi:hypothetical protein
LEKHKGLKEKGQTRRRGVNRIVADIEIIGWITRAEISSWSNGRCERFNEASDEEYLMIGKAG